MESSLSDGLDLFGLFGASRTTRARQGASRAGHAGEELARARVGQGMREEEMLSLMIVVGAFAGKKLDVKAVLVYW